jgi:hypothetical protein
VRFVLAYQYGERVNSCRDNVSNWIVLWCRPPAGKGTTTKGEQYCKLRRSPWWTRMS